MKVLIAPLNWGLGHASRCVPLVQRYLNEGHEVILGGDGESLTLLRKHFPKLRYVYLAPIQLRYSKGQRQVWAMLKAIPKLYLWALKDHAMLKAVLREEHIDQVVSDNRFGLYSKSAECIYMTHQLHILLPKGWRWAERIASRLHARIYTRFNKVWIPDYEEPEKCLAGELSHPKKLKIKNEELKIDKATIAKVIGLTKDRVNFVPELWEQVNFFFVAPTEYDEKSLKKRWKEDSPRHMQELLALLEGVSEADWHASREAQDENGNTVIRWHLDDVVMPWIAEKEYGVGIVMNAFRICLVGAARGPHIWEITNILGKEETIKRVKTAIEAIKL